MFVPDRERKVAVANEIVHRVAAEFGLTVAPLHTITKRVGLRRTFFNSYGDLFHPRTTGVRDLGERVRAAVDARVDTVAAIRQYLSKREAEELGAVLVRSRAPVQSRTSRARRRSTTPHDPGASTVFGSG